MNIDELVKVILSVKLRNGGLPAKYVLNNNDIRAIAEAISKRWCLIEHRWEYECINPCGPNCPAECKNCHVRAWPNATKQEVGK